MSNVLVINSGSTSIKYKVFDWKLKLMAEGNEENVQDHEEALKKILRNIINIGEIKAIGHRVVHGGDKFSQPTIINDEIIKELEELNNLAPLHNPYNLAGIKIMRDFLPDTPQIAVFDTAFYFSLPDLARYYALPWKISETYNIRRYGFHGISHQFVSEKAAYKLRKKINEINLITCHLGGGWSITAIKAGKPVDTSMGYTPMEGLIMMTRAGDVDVGIIFSLLNNDEIDSLNKEEHIKNIYKLLNYESGIKGLSGGINNFKDLLKEKNLGNKKAKLAFDLAIYRLIKYIGAYWFLLDGKVDAIVFTGGIGAGDPQTRNEVMRKLKFLKKVKTFSIKTDEELMIAKETIKKIT